MFTLVAIPIHTKSHKIYLKGINNSVLQWNKKVMCSNSDMNMKTKTNLPEVIFSQHILATDNPFIYQNLSICQHRDKNS